MKYYTSDLHLDHKNILKYESFSRPFSSLEEMNTTLILNWNKVVKPGDDVYILGDFAFCKGERANNFLDQLNGNKHLIVGNHDSFLKDKTFDRSKFVTIKYYDELRDQAHGQVYDAILFHYPIAVWNKKHHGSIHLYGHIHSTPISQISTGGREPNSYNVGVDVNDLKPMTLEQLIDKYGYIEPESPEHMSTKEALENFQSNI